MPTVLIVNGYRFYFYSGDRNEPVHVEKGDGVAKIWLEPSLNPQYFEGFKVKEKKEIFDIASQNYDLLKAKWNEFFY